MVLKSIRSIRILSFILFILFTTVIPFDNTQALNDDSYSGNLSLLNVFIGQQKIDQSEQLSRLYIPGILASPIVQQPAGENEFISSEQNSVTQFGLASKFGAIGLLAHNDLAGASFSQLEQGQKIYLLYGNGKVSVFVVTEILRYRALDPANTLSKFMDLKDNRSFTAPELFTKIYKRRGQVIFQTCISDGENLSWGRLFVIAEPYSQSTSN